MKVRVTTRAYQIAFRKRKRVSLMCVTINTEFILAGLLFTKTSPITIDILKSVKKNVYQHLSGKMIFFDITSSSVCSTVESNPRMFAWQNDSIVRANNSDNYFELDYIKKSLGRDLPLRIKEDVLNVIKDS
jgi:hypothetical protein